MRPRRPVEEGTRRNGRFEGEAGAWPDAVKLTGDFARLGLLLQDHRAGLIAASKTANSGGSGTRDSRARGHGGGNRPAAGVAQGRVDAAFHGDRPRERQAGRNDDLHEYRRRRRRVEIGSTWYRNRSSARRSTPSASYAAAARFEMLDCIAVEFRTHFFNHQSRRAIERLGRQAGRRAAQPYAHGGRELCVTPALFDHRQRMAGGPRQSHVADGKAE